jgi:hypothetical protein
MTLQIRDVIRRRDRMRTGTVAFRSAKRRVADIRRSASTRFVERDFNPGLPHGCFGAFVVLAFVIDFSSLGVGVKDFVDYFANVPVPLFKYRTGCVGAP